jgi:dihydroneopterin aldolase
MIAIPSRSAPAAAPAEEMTDMTFIKGVVIHARHGVMEHETEVGQHFVIDLAMSSDMSESSSTDRLSETVSYSDVVATATAAFKDDNYKLLERAAGAVAHAVLSAFDRILRGQGYRAQAACPIFEDVGVLLTRRR